MGITLAHTTPEVQKTGHTQLDAAKKTKLRKAVQEFEAIFVNTMLKAMKQTIQKEESDDQSFGSDLFDDLFNIEVAKAVSKQGSFGIAETLYKKLTGEQLRTDESDTASLLQVRAPKIRFAQPKSITSTNLQSSSSLTERVNRFHSIIESIAEQHGVDSTLVKAVIAAESAGNPRALSSKQAKGLMQLIDSTAVAMGVSNVWDPEENIKAGVKYLKILLEQFNGDVKLALASYNAGPSRVEKYGTIPPIPETQMYVSRVLKLWKAFQSMEGKNHE
ncbi:MAG: lytic transglycosylase domain-containing protein [Bacteroidetes bacterium]|nr:lytic transglycosylase domain-containing protein [Bacteroidota bacterium]